MQSIWPPAQGSWLSYLDFVIQGQFLDPQIRKESYHLLLQGFHRLSFLLSASLVPQNPGVVLEPALSMCGWNGQLEGLELRGGLSKPQCGGFL